LTPSSKPSRQVPTFRKYAARTLSLRSTYRRAAPIPTQSRPVLRIEPAEVTRQAVADHPRESGRRAGGNSVPGPACTAAAVLCLPVVPSKRCHTQTPGLQQERAPLFVFAQRNRHSQFEVSTVCSDAHATEEICSPLSMSQSPGSSRRNWTPEGANARSTLPPNS